MSISSSFSSNTSHSSSHVSSLLSLSEAVSMCFQYSSTFFSFTCFSVTNLLLLPLHVSIFYLGLRRRWKRRSATSHSDSFTYHMVAIEMIGHFACVLYCCGILISGALLMMLGVSVFTVSANGQIFFHILTCVERHLAVVHPIAYVSLRNRTGARIRNISLGCAWLLIFGAVGPMFQGLEVIMYQMLLLSVLSLLVVSFCSLSVLCTLNQPAPGTQGDKEQVNQSKMRAFHTITAIWATLMLRFGGHVFVILVFSFPLSESLRCGMLLSGVWFCLPSSLVLPLLFLHRAGKVLRCKEKTNQVKNPNR